MSEFLGKIKSHNWSSKSISSKQVDKVSKLPFTLISLLSNKTMVNPKMNFSEEIKSVSKILDLLSKAVSEGTVSEKDAEILIRYLLSNIVSNRVSNVFDNLFEDGHDKTSWFMAAETDYNM